MLPDEDDAARRGRRPQRRRAGRDHGRPGRAGRGRRGVEIADRLGAGVAKALLGKDVLPDDLPCVTGADGLLGTNPRTSSCGTATRC